MQPSLPYTLVRVLGRGASAEVHLVRQDASGELLVRKRILRGADGTWPEARVRREAQLLENLHHPNVVRLLALEVQPETLDLFYPFHPGSPLNDRVPADGGLPPSQVLPVLRDVLAGLDYLHQRGIVHRDIKPENVLVTDAGPAVLLDLGIARDLDAGTKLTATGVILCTPAYAAPEVFLGHPVAPAIDLYAAGALAFHCLAGHPPYAPGLSVAELMQHQKASPRPSLRAAGVDVPADLDDFIQVLLSPRPEDRPADAAIAVRLLDGLSLAPAGAPDAALGDATVSTAAPALPPAAVSNPGPTTKRVLSPRRHGLGAALGLGGLATLVTAAYLSTAAPPPPSPPPPAPTPEPAEAHPPALAAVRTLLDQWSPAAEVPPSQAFARLAKTEAIRGAWATGLASRGPRRQQVAAAARQLLIDGDALGFPPLVAPLTVPTMAPQPLAPPPARMQRVLRAHGFPLPPGLQLPVAAAEAARLIEQAAALSQPIDEVLRTDPAQLIGAPGELDVFSTYLSPGTGGSTWFVLSLGEDTDASRALNQAFAPVIPAALAALRGFTELILATEEPAARTAVVLWALAEFEAVAAPAALAAVYMPLDVLVTGLAPRAPSSIYAAQVLTHHYRVRRTRRLPLAEFTAGADAAARRAVEPGPAWEALPAVARGWAYEAYVSHLIRRAQTRETLDALARIRAERRRFRPVDYARIVRYVKDNAERDGSLSGTLRRELEAELAAALAEGRRLDQVSPQAPRRDAKAP